MIWTGKLYDEFNLSTYLYLVYLFIYNGIDVYVVYSKE